MVVSVNSSASLSLAAQLASGGAKSADPRGADKSAGATDSRDVAPSASASLASVREELLRAIGVIDLSIRGGRDGLDALATNGGDPAAAFAQFAAAIENAVNAGASLLKGEALRAPLEPGAAPFELAGEDVRVGDGAEKSAASMTALADRLSQAIERFSAAGARLEQHAGLLDRLDGAIAGDVKPNLDAESARLAALQISQTLAERRDGFGSSAASSLLALFRS